MRVPKCWRAKRAGVPKNSLKCSASHAGWLDSNQRMAESKSTAVPQSALRFGDPQALTALRCFATARPPRQSRRVPQKRRLARLRVLQCWGWLDSNQRMAESKSTAVPQSALRFGDPQALTALRCFATARPPRQSRRVPQKRRLARLRVLQCWGGWIRTNAWWSQSPLPYRLATPHYAAGAARTLCASICFRVSGNPITRRNAQSGPEATTEITRCEAASLCGRAKGSRRVPRDLLADYTVWRQ